MNEEDLEKLVIDLIMEKSKNRPQFHEDPEPQKPHTWENYGGWFAGGLGVISMIAAIFINFYDMKSDLNLQKTQIAALLAKDELLEAQETEIAVLKEKVKQILDHCDIKPQKRSELDRREKNL